MIQSRLIAKNLTALFAARITGMGLNLATTMLLARYLGVTGFGKYSFILAFVGVFQLLADSGLNNIMMREISVNKERLAHQLGITKSLIWLLSILVFILIVAIASFLHMDKVIRNATYIMGLAQLAYIHGVAYSSVFRALEEMEYFAAGFVFHKILLLGFAFVVIKLRLGIEEIAAAYAVSSIVLWFVYYVLIWKKYTRPRMVINPREWWYFIKEAAPLGFSSILRQVSWKVDILILTMIGSMQSVAFFSAPYKLIESAYLLPSYLTVVLFPLFSRLARDSHDKLFSIYGKNLKLLFIVCVPVVSIVCAYAGRIISVIYGAKFAPSAAALQLLSASILFLFPTSQFIYLFSSLGKQKLYAISSIISLAVNIILDFMLIPYLDFLGACIGSLAAEIMLFGAGLFFLKSIYGNITFTRAIVKPMLAGAVMWAAMFFFRNSSIAWMTAGIFAGAAVYFFTNMAMRTLSKKELSAIKESFSFFRKPPELQVNKGAE